MHGRSGPSESYDLGQIVELEDYTAQVLLEKKCIQPAVTPHKGIIKLKELKHGTDN